jgi:hypothetical protein
MRSMSASSDRLVAAGVGAGSSECRLVFMPA